MKKVAFLIVAMMAAHGAAAAEIPDLIKQLADVKTSQAAVDALVAKKDAAVPALIGEASEGKDLTARGWSIVCLSRIGGEDAKKALAKLTDDAKQPPLVRTWAVSARIDMAKTLDEAIALAPTAQSYPAAQRPLTMKVTELAADKDVPVGKLIAATVSNYSLQQVLAQPIVNAGPKPLTDAMLHDKDQQIRQMAAAYLGTLAQQQGKAGNEIVGDAVTKALAWDKSMTQPPWHDGPLYVPNIGWDKTYAKKLVGDLIAWEVWCDHHGDSESTTQINNNLNSLTLGGLLGYNADFNQHDALYWLGIWKGIAGESAVKDLLADQGVADDPRYKGAVR